MTFTPSDVRWRFPIGRRVYLSAEGRRQFPRTRNMVGTVVGYGNQGKNVHCIRVQYDGATQGSTWATIFWTPEDELSAEQKDPR